MFRFLIVAVSVVTLCLAGKERHEVIPNEQQAQASHSFEHGHYGGQFDGHGSFGDITHNNGAELSSLAHNSALQANNAVQNQHTAGNQAAFGIKSSLASAAIGAAAAAQAALVGKQAIVGNLKQQLTEAQQLLQGELSQYQQTEAAAQAARASANQAQTQLSTLTAAAAAAQGGAQHANQAAAEAANAEAAQHSMVVEAKQRVASLQNQLQGALGELRDTKASAHKALESAQQAQSNAAAAGVAVASSGAKGSDSLYTSHHEY